MGTDDTTTHSSITASQITQVYGGAGAPAFNPRGALQTLSTGTVPADPNQHPFFQSLGTNGRRCDSCHAPGQAWGISAAEVNNRFNQSQGTDPIFRLNDGSNAPNLPVSTFAERQAAYSQLTQRGLIRVGMPLPPTAEFNLTLVEDPYHFASANELSLFRRPLPSTNLKFLVTIMWDGRETKLNGTATDLRASLTQQAIDATNGHAQASTPLNATQAQQIVDFETSIFTAQITDNAAGSLQPSAADPTHTANGGPGQLAKENFFQSINDPLGGNTSGAAFTSDVFNIFDNWVTSTTATAAQKSIARGQQLFNRRAIRISGVRGVNDVVAKQPNLAQAGTVNGFCGTCHDAFNAGDHSTGLPLDLGLTDPDKFNTDIFPRYTLTVKSGVTNTTGVTTIRTSDPGRAMITGKWQQIALFKGPILRGLAPRAPYFHNGFAKTLDDVVTFYDTRFHIGFTSQEHADLVNFLGAL